MKEIKQILSLYGIYPVSIREVTPIVYKVNDGQHNYGLKRSSLSKETVGNWEAVFHEAHSNNLTDICPICLTKKKALYYERNQVIYYLSPWLESPESSLKELYQVLGNIHIKTKRFTTIKHEQIVSKFNTYKEHCKQKHKMLLSYVAQFERVPYMSPFELQVCTHYRDLNVVFRELNRTIDKFISEINENTRWNYSLCHGNLKRSHFINAKIINWEKSNYSHATSDLFLMFKNELQYYDSPGETFISFFKDYMDMNKLTKKELFLLSIYLLDPAEYIEKVQQYKKKEPQSVQVKQVKELEIVYRRLLFGLQWFDYVEKEYSFNVMEDEKS